MTTLTIADFRPGDERLLAVDPAPARRRRAPWPLLCTASRFAPIKPAPLPGSQFVRPPVEPTFWPQDRLTYSALRESLRAARHRDAAETEDAERADPVRALYNGPCVDHATSVLSSIGDPRMRQAVSAWRPYDAGGRIVLHGEQLMRRERVLTKVGARRLEAERRARMEAYARGE